MKFLKKVGNSIVKTERYAEMAADGVKSAIKYALAIVAIMSIVVGLGSVYRTNQTINELANYIENNIPEFSYKDGNISVEGEQPVTIESKETGINKIIIDTNDKTEEEISKYKETLKESGIGMLILKDKIILLDNSNEVSNNIKDMLAQFGINESNEFTKTDFLQYLHGNQMFNVYIGIFTMTYIYAIIMYMIQTLGIAAAIAIIGYFVAMILKVKMRYRAVFNMAVYSLTLSSILQMIYLGVNIFTTFNITYFDIMYSGVALIYLIAAIFLTKIDLEKQQEELTKVEEVQKEVREKIEEDKKKEEKDKKNETDDKKEKEKKDKEKSNKETNKKGKTTKKKTKKEQGGEPEGSNV